jgi:hypothetical protein
MTVIEKTHLDNLGDLGIAARRPQHGAAPELDAVNLSLRKLHRFGVAVQEAAQAVPDAQDLVVGHTVVGERGDDVQHDVIQPRAQAAARHNRRGHVPWVMVDVLARTRPHGELRQHNARAVRGVEHALALRAAALLRLVLHDVYL